MSGAGSSIHPGRRPGGRFRFPRQRRAFPSSPATPVFVPSVPGVGAVGAALLVLSLEPGTKVVYSWGTDIFKSYSGSEQRSNTTGALPRLRFEGQVFLLDGDDRSLRSALMRSAAAGAVFSLALPYEELALSADSTGTTVTVESTALSDWARAGQRVVIVGVDDTTVAAVIQSVTATTMLLGVVDSSGALVTVSGLGTTGRAGGRIMPLLQVLLDPAQGFARYPQTVGLWAIRAKALAFGWAGGVDAMGIGTSIVTYTAGVPVPVADVTESDLLIWDRPNAIDGIANESMLSLSETVDLGGVPFGIGGAPVPDWARPIRYSSSSLDDWQWVKAFMRKTLGRQKVFLLSTNHDDLIFVSTASTGIKVASTSVAGAGDYTAWFVSLAHRRLALTRTDGTIQYVAVVGVVDNGDGTLTLTLDSGVLGTVARISLLEQVRFDNNDSDDFPVTWDGGTFSVDLLVRAVQESIVPPTLFLFDTVINLAFVWGGTLPPSANEFSLTLGKSTFVNMTTDRTMNVGGLSITGTGPLDGQIVCLKNGGATGVLVNFVSEDTAWPDSHRMVFGAGAGNGTGSCFWFVFNAAANRWLNIMVA